MIKKIHIVGKQKNNLIYSTKKMISKQKIKKLTGLDGYKLIIHQKRKKEIIKIVNQFCEMNDHILDVGCATGDISVELSLAGFNIHGIDMSEDSIIKAKNFAKKFKQNILFEQNTFETLQINKKFDLILMGEIIEHFPNPSNVLDEALKFLNKNGKILITTPNMPSFRNRLKFGLLGIFPDNNPQHKYYFDRKRFNTVIETAGYDIEYFKTKFTNFITNSKILPKIESVVFSWVSKIFALSGDTIFAVITPQKTSIKLNLGKKYQ